jgi:hypothetical protein
MKFNATRILTGVVEKTSKKTGNKYVMFSYLNDDGLTFSSMANSDLVIPKDLKQLSSVDVELEVTFYNGNVNGVRTNSIALKKVS